MPQITERENKNPNMVSSGHQSTNLVYNLKLSSVGPTRVTGTDIIRAPTSLDLAMKLHYLKGVYFFRSRACEGLNIARFKEGLFYWCNEYYMVCGRYLSSPEEGGRPVMKCNDCGVRLAEAQCDLTVEEWIKMISSDKDGGMLNNDLLIYHRPLGPHLFFSPPCYMQLTKFKCGGMSFGVSWAHILGDAFTFADSIAKWTQYLAGRRNSDDPLTYVTPLPRPQPPSELATWPLSINQVDPVGDHWITPNSSKMAWLSFFLSSSEASHVQAKVGGGFPLFESICAVVWHCIARVRAGLEPNTVTICKKDPGYVPKASNVSNMGQVVSSVTAESPGGSGFSKLASLLVNMTPEEQGLIDAALEKDDGVKDYVLYGANLTFVSFEGAKLYGLEWNGIGPELVYYGIQGVGDGGAVWVVPWRRSNNNNYNNNNNNNNNNTGGSGNLMGRIVTIVVGESEVDGLKLELKKSGLPV